MAHTSPTAALAVLDRGWADHQARLLDVIRPLTDEQMQLRPAPDHWAVWQLAANMAGGRACWFHDVLGEGEPAVRDMFRVAATTVPDLLLEDAFWEDEEDQPRTAAEVVDALQMTWEMVDDCLRRWTEEALQAEFPRPRGDGRTFSRAWVIWNLMEHDLHHGTEIALILPQPRPPYARPLTLPRAADHRPSLTVIVPSGWCGPRWRPAW